MPLMVSLGHSTVVPLPSPTQPDAILPLARHRRTAERLEVRLFDGSKAAERHGSK